MRALVLNGFGKDDDASGVLQQAVADELTGMGAEVAGFMLADEKIAYCVGCFGCWLKTPGICLIDDVARDIAKAIVNSDLLIYLTPITFGGYSSELKKALDRMIPIISPFFMKVGTEVHHKKRYDKYPELAVIGVLPEPDQEEETIFTKLVERNGINLYTTGHSSVVLRTDGPEEIRRKVKSVLAEMGVAK